ncbi:MAG TPA: transketolase family protein [Candidatus Aerophobetes bacterium]|uniref:Transketolase family protein n=1 Tax=Aerophobetes bacterium TaxID=2030807 RepID=A0A7V5HYB1_UNCAE|nr:transketolase family protein [Candidatus Aerophobetes bacterium]
MSSKIAPREAFGRTLVNLAEKNENIVVLDADLAPSTKVTYFRERFPERFIPVGIAEQNMIGIAAGLSTLGFIPFATTFACFASRRVCDQVTVSCAYPRLNVKIVGAYVGLFVGKNGATHQALEDIAIMRSIANMVVIEPVDAIETEKVVEFACEYDGPVYLRIGRDPMPQIVPSNYNFSLGKGVLLKEGKDVTLISSGALVEDTLKVADNLEKEGISAKVINMSCIKPIDEEIIVKAAEETGSIVTVENHNIIGGLGSAVAEVISEKYPARLKRIGIRDTFGKSGTNEEMKKKFKLTVEDITREIKIFLG